MKKENTYQVKATINGSENTFNCGNITDVKNQLHFIKLDREKYGGKWSKIKVIAIKTDITRLVKKVYPKSF